MPSVDDNTPALKNDSSTTRSLKKSMGLLAPFLCLIQDRQIVYFLTRKRIVTRYRGSVLGLIWSFIVPALTLAIYTLVFGVILESRWSRGDSTTTEYAFLLYLGLCVYWLVSECVSEAPSLVHNHTNYVKKVVFPLEILPWVNLWDALFHSTIRLGVFVIALTLFQGPPPLTILLLPLVWLPLCLWTLGLCWILAAAGAYWRDLREIIGLILVGLLFLSPTFYSLDAVPEATRNIIMLNPISFPLMQTRDVAYYGNLPDPLSWFGVLIFSLIFASVGHAVFARSRKGFADVV